MRIAILAACIGLLHSVGPSPHYCAGALVAQLLPIAAAQEPDPDTGPHPERHTPAGEWCQREPVQSKKAHACSCHSHDCTDPDPSHVSAHTDFHCLNYCTQAQCRCGVNDCP